MILLCNGDSWTQGDSPAQTPNWEATKTLDWYDIIPDFGDGIPRSQRILYKFYDSPIWPKILGEKLGVETWNTGRLGTSNQTIFRTTINSINYLRELGKNDIFVVIAWTTKYRNEIWKPNGYYDTFQYKHYPNFEHFFGEKDDVEYRLYFQKMMKFYADTINTEEKILDDYIYCVLNLQNFLKHNNIKYLFFNAFDDPFYKIKNKKSFYDYVDFNNVLNNKCENHFRKYIEDSFDVNWMSNNEYFIQSHPTNLSHSIWANHLYEYIINNLEK